MLILDARRQYIRWLRATRNLSTHTVRAYEGDLAAFERHVGAHTLARNIEREQLLTFLEDQRSSGLASATIKRRASGVRGLCRWLVEGGLLDADPWVGLSVSTGRSRRLPRLVPEATLDALLASLRYRAGMGQGGAGKLVERHPHETTTLLGVALMVATGVRVNELVSIRCENIDVVRRTVRILGKGSRERQVYLTNDWLTDLTRDYLSVRLRLGVEHDRLLFNRYLAPLTPPAMRSRLATITSGASLGARVTPHMLRHTAATRLIEAGVDIRLIQTLLGHASLSTTEIYTHVSNTALQRVLADADVLGEALALR